MHNPRKRVRSKYHGLTDGTSKHRAAKTCRATERRDSSRGVRTVQVSVVSCDDRLVVFMDKQDPLQASSNLFQHLTVAERTLCAEQVGKIG